MALTLKAQIPVATTAIRRPHVARRVFFAHVEDHIVCDELDEQDARLVARFKPTRHQEPREVRKADDQYFVEIIGVDLEARSIPYEPYAASNLFHDGSVHSMFREVFKESGEVGALEAKWSLLSRKPFTNLRRMGLRDIDKEMVDLQVADWRDFLKPPILVNGRLFRPCDEPFLELAHEDQKICYSLFTDRDWCGNETYAVYSLPEIPAVKPMAAMLRKQFGRPTVKRDFEILRMDEDAATFSSHFLYRRFGLWGEAISYLLGWVALSPAGRVKFAADLTPAHQSSLLEIDRAVRAENTWVRRGGTDAALAAMTTLRHDPHFDLHIRHHYADWADILIRELEAAPIVPFGLNARGIGLD